MKQVGRYQIVEELGRGAMGVVYKALDPAIGRTVAIKTIRLSDLSDPDERRRVHDRLLREAQSAGVLSHPNIVTIYDILEQDDFAYVFMEYVNGASLEKMMATGTLPESYALLEYLRQVADALDYAHRKGIVHRDIKPANIIISEAAPGAEQLAKIADFGVAKFVSHEITHSGTMIGTPSYMSPEQIQGMTVDGRSDQFSLAVLVYELACGQKPFAADNLPALFYAICKQKPQPVDEVNSKLNETVARVLEQALAKGAKERFASCADFIAALAVALDSTPQWNPVARATVEAGGGVLLEATADNAPKPLQREMAKPPEGGIMASRAAPYDLPTRPRLRRDEEFESAQRRSVIGTIATIIAVCLAIAGVIAFIVRSNSGPNIPRQVVDTTEAPLTPPPLEPNQPANRSIEAAPPAKSTEAVPPKSTEALAPKSTEAAPSREAPRTEPHPPSAPRPAPPPEANAPSEGVADIELLSEPPGAKLVVDNRPDASCTAPCTMSLQNGRHTLTAELPGYNLARRIFTIPDDTSLFIAMTQSTGVLFVTSVPLGAAIYVDGQPYGRTPATLHLPAGSHHLVVTNGSMQREDTVIVQNDGFEARSFRFQ